MSDEQGIIVGMRVDISLYDARWQMDFERISRRLWAVLHKIDVLAVGHVGSTSVPGMPAKPVIDIDIVVGQEAMPQAVDALRSVGYVYEGEKGVPGRHAFIAPDADPRRNVYVCVDGCLALRNHLAVRDTLRRDRELRADYARVKSALAERDLENMDRYVAGKNAVLQKVLAAAGMSMEDLEAIASANPSA